MMRRLGYLVLGVLPWAVIAGLLAAAIYLEPAAVEEAVQPAALSRSDHFYGAAHVAPDSFWLAGNVGKIVHSQDAGRTWLLQDTPVEGSIQAIAAWSEQELIAVGDGGAILRTGDGGTTWERIEVELSDIADKLIRVRVMDDGSAWAVGEYGAVLVSRDRGMSWDNVAESGDVTWHDIAVAGESLCVVGEFGRIMISSDGGTNWNQIAAPAKDTLNAVSFRDADNGVAVGLQGTVLITVDGGVNWQRVASATGEHLYAVVWNGSQWLATGDNGVVLQAGAGADPWQASQISERDYSWHTDIVALNEGWFLIGGNSGIYGVGDWHPMYGNQQQEMGQ